MDKLQYDSFYKFMVSAGVVLVAAPLVGLLLKYIWATMCYITLYSINYTEVIKEWKTYMKNNTWGLIVVLFSIVAFAVLMVLVCSLLANTTEKICLVLSSAVVYCPTLLSMVHICRHK